MTPLPVERHQGPGGLEPRARAAGPLQREGRDGALPRRGDPDGGERRGPRRPDDDHLEAQARACSGPDGTPVTADDAVFTWQYCTHPEGGCAQAPNFGDVANVEAVDPLTVKVTFGVPKPYPYGPVRRRAVADHPEGAVRRLPRRQRPDLHRGQHQARSAPGRSASPTSRRTTWCCSRPTRTTATREAGLRHRGPEGRRRRGERRRARCSRPASSTTPGTPRSSPRSWPRCTRPAGAR